MDADIEHLKGELADPTCTGWTCPYCRRSNYKGAYFGEEFMFWSPECDECGFDCTGYAPATGIAHHSQNQQ